MTVQEAMKVGRFSDKEIEYRAKQAWIHCRWKKIPTRMKNDEPPQLNVVINNRAAEDEESLSSVTGTSSSSESRRKKAKCVRTTGSARQSAQKAQVEDRNSTIMCSNGQPLLMLGKNRRKLGCQQKV